MILAQKQGSSKSDIELYCDKWKYDTEKQNYHLKLMTKLAKQSQSPLKWNLVTNTWKLPTTHPFYNNKPVQSTKEQKENKDDADDQDEENQSRDRNNYSIWSSVWSSSVIGQTYLNECGENVAQIIQSGESKKVFGDVELDLTQYKEDLLAYADCYAPIEELNIGVQLDDNDGDVEDV